VEDAIDLLFCPPDSKEPLGATVERQALAMRRHAWLPLLKVPYGAHGLTVQPMAQKIKNKEFLKHDVDKRFLSLKILYSQH
jgi:hypothetical protein